MKPCTSVQILTGFSAGLVLALIGSTAAIIWMARHMEPPLPLKLLSPPASPPLASLRPDPVYYGAPGLTLSLPPSDKALTFFAHGSCADQEKPQHFWPTISNATPDVFIFNGDIVYGDCENVTNCDALPMAWKKLSQNQLFRQAVAAVPMIGVLDDHDYGANDCHEGLPKFEAWKQFAKSIFLERFGIPLDDVRRYRPGVYRAWAFGPPGRRTQIVTLDIRWFRSPFVPTDCRMCPGKERYVPYNKTNGPGGGSGTHPTILGESQWTWLEGVLREPAELRFIVSTIQILPRGHGWERWGLIPSEVDRLVKLIAKTQARGVILLSGDRHTGGIYRVQRADALAPPYDLIEVTSSSLTHSFRADEDEPGALRLGGQAHENNFGGIAIDWDAKTVHLDLRTSDTCGTSRQKWHEICEEPGSDVAGRVLKSLTLGFDDLA